MRVVFLSAARQVWGAEVSLLTLADALVDAGVPTALVCPSGGLAQRARRERFETVLTTDTPESRGEAGRVRESLDLWRTYLRSARRGDRVVVFSYYLLGLAPVFAPVLRARGVRVSLDLHDTLNSRKARWAVFGGSLFCDRVIACSAYTATQLARHPRVSHLHRPVVDTGAADGPVVRRPARPGRSRTGLRVGIVGRISPEKRHELVIDAVGRSADDVELVVRGGDDGWAGSYPADIARVGHDRLGDRFHLEGTVAPEEAMTGLDVVVVGNPEEPMGRTVLEAQDRGAIAVVPDSGGASELVDDGVTGLVYRRDDPAHLASTLERARDTGLADGMADAASRSVPRPAEYARRYRELLG